MIGYCTVHLPAGLKSKISQAFVCNYERTPTTQSSPCLKDR
uniref:Uncharacterized protein n=1 Tax=Arundo donax TaxID=35708 RepID=A0A0A9AHK7_ARUDO